MLGVAFLSIAGIVYWVFATRNTGTCMWADVGAGSRLVWEFAGVSSIVSLLVPQNTILYCNFKTQNSFTSYNLINTPKRLGVISAPTMVSLGWISLLYKYLFQKVNITILLGLLTFLVPWEPAFEIKLSVPARHRTQQWLETLICVHSKQGLKHPPSAFLTSVRKAHKAFFPCHVTMVLSAFPFQPSDPITERLIGINSHVNSQSPYLG